MRLTLQQRLRDALLSDSADHLWSDDFDATGRDADRIAAFVLVTLGLDDIDAVVDRAANALGQMREGDAAPTEQERIWARAMLEAALLATEGEDG